MYALKPTKVRLHDSSIGSMLEYGAVDRSNPGKPNTLFVTVLILIAEKSEVCLRRVSRLDRSYQKKWKKLLKKDKNVFHLINYR